ncbi:hypothetical protein HXX76_009014 [Chlamydomonas incerta]|uniref:Uncharacterized protein n=1 Tax=Chlamydomonas incerta TaxID=51695 RepID=A0A835VWM9_CHLIN|nr:hypothetical protein HXX76_009014 [Chlamydomonas incerta]|eukprot:KAG2432087.1 hypothetical protein HXX76_009014 [Chlamydomonas incerta]
MALRGRALLVLLPQLLAAAAATGLLAAGATRWRQLGDSAPWAARSSGAPAEGRTRWRLALPAATAGFPVLLNPALDVIDGVGRPGLVQPPNADRDAAAATASLCQQVGLAAAGTLAQCANLPGGPRPTGGRRLRSVAR